MFDTQFIEELTNRIADTVVRRLPAAKIAQRYMSYSQAGEYTGVSEESIRYYVSQRWLSVASKGAKRWLDKEDIDRFMSSHKDYNKAPRKQN
jgi:hypothetical protein